MKRVPPLSITASSRSRSNGAVSIGFHSMMDDESTHQANRVCDLNHRGTDCVVNKAMSLANPYRFGITNNEYVDRDFNLLTRYPPRLIAHPTSHGALIAPQFCDVDSN